MTVTTRRVRPDEGALLREVRLGALADEPTAFGSTHAAEAELPSRRWDEWAVERSEGPDHATFFATDGRDVVGLVGGHRTDDATIELVSMWTDASARGRGVGAALVGAVVAWAGDARVELWVTQGNDAAVRLYERCGFVTTGDFQPPPSDPCKDEIRMRREPL
ncbi:MAG: GNAT family N-acetyltransferase [Acidimicrobiales bacterium]